MPFSGSEDPKLPSNVQKLTKPQREKWVATWNSTFENCRNPKIGGQGTVEKCESVASKIANGTIKKEGAVEDETNHVEKQELTEAEKMHMADSPSVVPVAVVETVGEFKPFGGAQDFDELDDWVEAREQQFQVDKVTYGAQELISNVMQDEDVENRPNKLQKIVDGMRTRLSQALTKSASVVAPTDEGNKQTTKTEDGVQFRAGDFAVVPDADKPSTWKLRLAEGSSGNFTVAQVARAITAMQPGGFRGQRVELKTEQKAQAVKRIGTAIGKTDGTDDQKDNLRRRLDRIKDLPEGMKSFQIVKDKEGGLRWLGMPTNKWRDRDTPAQIIEETAHKEFVSFLNETKDFPELLSWHTPGTRIGVADWVDYSNGFLVMSGPIDKDKYGEAERLAEKCQAEDIGMSHGFVYTYSDKENEIIGHYRIWEVSHLPTSFAANVWTAIDILKKEVSQMSFNPEKRTYLVGLHGEEVVASLEAKAADLEKDLQSAGIEWKEAAGEQPTDPKAIMEETAKVIVESEGFKTLISTVGTQAAAIKAMETEMATIKAAVAGAITTAKDAEETAQSSVDKIIADAVSARSSAFQPSKDASPLTDEDKEKLRGPEADKTGIQDGMEEGFFGPAAGAANVATTPS